MAENQGPMHASTHGLAMTGVINSVFSSRGSENGKELDAWEKRKGETKISRDEGEIGLS